MQPAISIGLWHFNSYGVCLTAALLSGSAMFIAELRRRSLTQVRPLEFLAVMTCGAILGARVDWVLGHWGSAPVVDLLRHGGFTFYGALILDGIAVLALSRQFRISPLYLSDAMAVPCTLAYGIARMGCFLSGDGCYGTVTTVPWGMSFPHGVVPTLERVHPTPLYECLASMLIALCLWQLGSPRKRAHVPVGAVCAWGLISTGAMRFVVEFIRTNPRLHWGLTEAQMIGLLSIVVGIALLQSRRMRRPALELLNACKPERLLRQTS